MACNPKISKTVFPVGGMGTRFLPATKAMPKEMLTVVDKPIIQYAVEEAWAAGLEQAIFVTGKGKTAIEDHFDYAHELHEALMAKGKTDLWTQVAQTIPKPGSVAYIRQQEPLGLGHAVWCARHYIHQEPFAVVLADDLVLADDPCLRQMVAAFATLPQPCNMLALARVPLAQTHLYGIVEPETQEGRLVRFNTIIEKPAPGTAPSQWAVIGRYILQPDVFALLETQQRGAGNEIQLTDALAVLARQQPFYGYVFDGTRYDCGHHLGFLQANIAFGLQRPQLKAGLSDFLKEIV